MVQKAFTIDFPIILKSTFHVYILRTLDHTVITEEFYLHNNFFLKSQVKASLFVSKWKAQTESHHSPQ